MKYFYLISIFIISVLTSFVVSLNYIPDNLGSTLTTISSSDLIKNSRSVINTNFSTLDTDKLERSAWFGTSSAPQLITLSNLATVGTITSGTWHGSTLAVGYGGTGSTTLASNQVLLGNGTGALAVVSGLGSSGQLLTSQGAGNPPYWASASFDVSQNYTFTGHNIFNGYTNLVGNTSIGTASATVFSVNSSPTASTSAVTKGWLEWDMNSFYVTTYGDRGVAATSSNVWATSTIVFTVPQKPKMFEFDMTLDTDNASNYHDWTSYHIIYFTKQNLWELGTTNTTVNSSTYGNTLRRYPIISSALTTPGSITQVGTQSTVRLNSIAVNDTTVTFSASYTTTDYTGYQPSLFVSDLLVHN